MFPDALHFHDNELISGKVFSYQLDSSQGPYARRIGRKFSANTEEWDDCRACPEFEHCYKLCMAKMALESVIVAE